MQGQWIGKYRGARTGLITLNLDDRSDHYGGYAHLVDDSGQFPPAFVILKSKGKSSPLTFDASIIQVHSGTHVTLTHEELKTEFPEFVFPTTATVNAIQKGQKLEIVWKTNIGTSGTGSLRGGSVDEKSKYKPIKCTWTKFKIEMDRYPARKFIYRGQEKPWKLQTSFHRAGRADVLKFQFDDIPTLHRALSSRTKHIYNLSDGDQNGAFFHLIQHHGYPTPLLDWSYSPYVAAFWAFRKISPITLDKSGVVRIFMFDHLKWHNDWEKIQTLRTHKLHLSVLDFTAIDNDRMIPQQALSCVTNIHDIENYIREREKLKSTHYLKVFDLPASQRNLVIADLSLMGITAGSMFPGIEGMCEEIRERLFNFGR
jgi:hypothetical protein